LQLATEIYRKWTAQRLRFLKIRVLGEEYDLDEIVFAIFFLVLAYLSGLNVNMGHYLPAGLAMGEVLGILIYIWKIDL
jgi:hypothetical protein